MGARQVDEETIRRWISEGVGSTGGSSLESYQNSVMSAPVMAYVLRDEEDNIFKVYEPIRNNVVSRSQFAYADSIDQFAFDNVNNYDNVLSDVKLVTVPAATVFQNCQLYTMIINATSKTGVEFINHNQWCNYGNGIIDNDGHGEEIYITGNNVVFDGNYVRGGNSEGNPTFFDDLGEDSQILNAEFGNSCYIFGNGFKMLITDCDIGQFTWFTIAQDMTQLLLDVVTEESCYIELNNAGAALQSSHIDALSTIVINSAVVFNNCKVGVHLDLIIGHNITNCDFGVAATYNSSGDKDRANFIRIGGTTYEIGELTGAATLTPV